MPVLFPPGNRRNWRMATGVLLSVLPGLGHVHARLWGLGVTILAASLILSLIVQDLTHLLAPTPGVVLGFFVAVAVILLVQLGIAVDAARRERTAPERPRPRWFRSTWLAAAVFLAAGSALQGPYGWRAFSIPSASMEPTLLPGELWLSQVARTRERGDIVAFRTAGPRNDIFVKRVIGVGGDLVALHGGHVWLNGKPLVAVPDGRFVAPGDPPQELQRWTETLPGGASYTTVRRGPLTPADERAETMVPPGHVYVLGDFRDNSVDSRFPEIGTVPLDNVVGSRGVLYWSKDRSRLLQPVR